MNPVEEPLKILILEDDPLLARAVFQSLSDDGYQCKLSTTGSEAVQLAQSDQFQIMILDLGLEDQSGLGVLRCIRESSEACSVIVLTPIEFSMERKAALESGADDFVVKPFVLNEIRARVEAVLIRSRTRPKTVLEAGPVNMNLTTRRVSSNGHVLSLTPTEFRILEILLRNQGKAVTRRMLCEFIWEPDWEGVTNVIEVHINRLRSKLREGVNQPLIHTIRGCGYTFRWEPATVEQ
jgi:two-component system OmpR family response regulator/two-component system copper resistance phosphate regulon response regulator CusR